MKENSRKMDILIQKWRLAPTKIVPGTNEK
jgi:hypothetical protein